MKMKPETNIGYISALQCLFPTVICRHHLRSPISQALWINRN